jgi:ATP-dependent helicase/nuclease subunit B
MSIMSYPTMPLLPCADGWDRLARALAEHDIVRNACPMPGNYSGLRIVVPRSAHAQLLEAGLAAHAQYGFIAPRITTLPDWLAQLSPEFARRQAVAPDARMVRTAALYAEMRRHPWLQRLFHAKRNTDLLPVAQSLLKLFDELSETLLPSMQTDADASDAEWRTALESLSMPAQGMLSDEARLVWTLWQGQLAADDSASFSPARIRRLAGIADAPLVWIDEGSPQPLHDVLLEAYAERFPVLRVMPDWRQGVLAPACAAAWPETLDDVEAEQGTVAGHADPEASVFLYPARSLEDEARHAAQTVVQWMQEGKTRIAVVAQDPAAARRTKALLGRAGLIVSDATERKLAATRPAAMLAALLDVAASRAEVFALLDLLKCPGLCADLPDKAELVIDIELALRRANVPGGWHAVLGAVARQPRARMLLLRVAGQAWRFAGRKTVRGWARLTADALHALGMREAIDADAAGMRLAAMLDKLAHEESGPGSRARFGLAEWRAMLGMQLDSTTCPEVDGDARVTMLPLDGTCLRRFDAVVMVGADAAHLPRAAEETLPFAGTVRRELGLTAHEVQQRMQLRHFAELLNANPEVVLCWQAARNSEPNAASPWIERLRLALEQNGKRSLPIHHVVFPEQRLRAEPPSQPMPAAPDLLPGVLSVQAYHSLIACPYQFFAARMLGLAPLDELNPLPEKRDYGGWLHAILKTYHETVRDNAVGTEARESLLRDITEQVFTDALTPGGEAPGALVLGYYARWKKAIPAYLEWAGEREAGGWRFVFGEQMLEKVLEWEGGQVVLRGKVDRIDEHPDGSRAILDYKAQRLPVLRDKLRDGEDHQLAFRAVLSDVPVTAGHLVALETNKSRTGDAAAEQFIEWQERLEGQIVRNMQAIAGGASLPATGIERICIHCEVRGLCRKGAW